MSYVPYDRARIGLLSINSACGELVDGQCRHMCAFRLTNGRIFHCIWSAKQIDIVIKGLAKQVIVNPVGSEHFSTRINAVLTDAEEEELLRLFVANTTL